MAILASLAIAAIAYRISRRWLWPPVVLALLWTAVFAGAEYWSDDIDPISSETEWLVLAGIAAFLIGGIGGRLIAAGSPVPDQDRPLNTKAAWWAVALLALAFAPVAFLLGGVHDLTQGDNLLASVNQASGEGEIAFGIYLWIFRALFAVVLFLVVKRQGRWWLLLAMVGASLVFAARNTAFMVIVGLAFAAYLSGAASAKRVLSVAVVVSLLLFLGLGTLRGHFGEGDDLDLFARVFRNYFVGGLAAFNDTVATPANAEWGLNTFRSVCLWLRQLGVTVEVKPLIQEGALVPFWTNVYTAFDGYYRDFGWVGVLGLPAVAGYVSAYFFGMAERYRHNAYYVGMAALMFYPTLLTFLDEQFYKQLSNWLFIGCALWACDRLLVLRSERQLVARAA